MQITEMQGETDDNTQTCIVEKCVQVRIFPNHLDLFRLVYRISYEKAAKEE